MVNNLISKTWNHIKINRCRMILNLVILMLIKWKIKKL